MMRAIGGVILGYIAMAVAVMITLTVAYLVLGLDGSFKEGSWDASMTWLIVSGVLGLAAAIVGGLVCTLISRGGKAPMVLAGIVLVLGLLMALPIVMAEDDPASHVRTGDANNWEAMSNAKQPAANALLTPIIGAVGVMIGAGLKRNKKR
jgi:hypothetical protein